jgi:hypothetical protein
VVGLLQFVSEGANHELDELAATHFGLRTSHRLFRIKYANFRAISNIGLTRLSYCGFLKTHTNLNVFFLTGSIKESQRWAAVRTRKACEPGISAKSPRSPQWHKTYFASVIIRA